MAIKTKLGVRYVAPVIPGWRSENHFEIPGVHYRGEVGTYALFESMTDSLDLQQLSELYERAKQAGNPVPANMQLVWQIITKRLEDKSQDSEKFKQFLYEGIRRVPNTLTGVLYSPKGDTVVHNYGTSDEFSLPGRVWGEEGYVNEIKASGVLKRLLGNGTLKQINQIAQRINRTDAYLWRVNSELKNEDLRVARFGACGVGLVLGCEGGLLSGCPAFRVLRIG